MNKQALLKEVVSLKEEGLGSRKIANKLGISKSCVNNWYREYIENAPEIKKTLKRVLSNLSPPIRTAKTRLQLMMIWNIENARCN